MDLRAFSDQAGEPMWLVAPVTKTFRISRLNVRPIQSAHPQLVVPGKFSESGFNCLRFPQTEEGEMLMLMCYAETTLLSSTAADPFNPRRSSR